MTRSLEGEWFHTCYNNGVEALVSSRIYQNMQKKNAVTLALENMGKGNGSQEDMLPHISETPVFTFAEEKRMAKSPWFTGHGIDWHCLLNYITRNGGRFSNDSFHVPFSNGSEMGLHGPEAQLNELRYVTTDAQFEETFGISLGELRDSGDKYL